ncbi:KAT8 regulatory NSL complex subunit 1 isoform X2 [Amia ocellicauda]|uniref:KAT8 regulatory NSL complex subunit 1 isoform X2 n=1 Tax=Amia ocellicauda TaxID=2972642 RepID=UPI0034640325
MYFYFIWPKMSGSAAVGGGGAAAALSISERGSGGDGGAELVNGEGGCAASAAASDTTPAPGFEAETGSARAREQTEMNSDDYTHSEAEALRGGHGVRVDSACGSSGETGGCGEDRRGAAGGKGEQADGARNINIDEKSSGLKSGGNWGGQRLRTSRTVGAAGRVTPEELSSTARYSNGEPGSEGETAGRSVAPATAKRQGGGLSRAPKRVRFTVPAQRAALSGGRECNSRTEVPEPGQARTHRLQRVEPRGCEGAAYSARITVPWFSTTTGDSCPNNINSSHGREPRSAKGRVRLYRVRSFLTSTAADQSKPGRAGGNGVRCALPASTHSPALSQPCPGPGPSVGSLPRLQDCCPRLDASQAVSLPGWAFRKASQGADDMLSVGKKSNSALHFTTKGGGVGLNGVRSRPTPNGLSTGSRGAAAALVEGKVSRPVGVPSLQAIETGRREAGQRQVELEAQTKRLWRRLQAVQVKQMERHVVQQLSGLELQQGRGGEGVAGRVLPVGERPFLCGALQPLRLPRTAEVTRLARSCAATLRTVESALDSDATASSSGGDSDGDAEDNMGAGGHTHTALPPPCTLRDSAEWQWAERRAWLGSRWAWLQAQVSDLEYRIRSQTDLHSRLRQDKVPVVVKDTPHPGQLLNSCYKQTRDLPHSLDDVLPTSTPPRPPRAPCPPNGTLCSSVPGPPDPLRKRLQEEALPCSPNHSGTAARVRALQERRQGQLLRLGGGPPCRTKSQAVCVQCSCEPPSVCVLCGGGPPSPQSAGSVRGSVWERRVRLDPCLHHVLSQPRDVPLAVHCGLAPLCPSLPRHALRRREEPLPTPWLDSRVGGPQRLSRQKRKLPDPHQSPGHTPPHPPHPTCADGRSEKLNKSSVSLSVVTRPLPECPLHTAAETPLSTPPQPSRRRRGESSFDINNMVMPLGLGGGARVQKLQYKEILTPSWRQLDCASLSPAGQVTFDPGNPPSSLAEEEGEEVEDMLDAVFLSRHSVCEDQERSRWGSWAQRASQRRGGRSSARGEGKLLPPQFLGYGQPASPEPIPEDLWEPWPLSPPEVEDSSGPLADDEELAVLPWERRSFPLSEDELLSLKEEEPSPPPSYPPEDPTGARSHSTDSGISVGSLELSPVAPRPPLPAQDLQPAALPPGGTLRTSSRRSDCCLSPTETSYPPAPPLSTTDPPREPEIPLTPLPPPSRPPQMRCIAATAEGEGAGGICSIETNHLLRGGC